MPKSVEERRLKAWIEATRMRLTAELAELGPAPDWHGEPCSWHQEVQLRFMDKSPHYAKSQMLRERGDKRKDRKSRWWSKLNAGLSYPSRKAYGSKQRPNR